MPQQHRKLVNDLDRLIEDLVEGMVSAHPDLLSVEGETRRAIVARIGPRDGKVGIVIGGGSGQEPAFAGHVGKRLADAAPLGNIFASPMRGGSGYDKAISMARSLPLFSGAFWTSAKGSTRPFRGRMGAIS